jgi:hypothetical protein
MRITKQVAARGPLVEVEPDGVLAVSVLRLLSGAIKKDFRDRFEVELALFDFVRIVILSALLPSPKRICKMSDNRDYVNYIHLHTRTIPYTHGTARSASTLLSA